MSVERTKLITGEILILDMNPDDYIQAVKDMVYDYFENEGPLQHWSIDSLLDLALRKGIGPHAAEVKRLRAMIKPQPAEGGSQ